MTRKHYTDMANMIGRIANRDDRARMIADFIIFASDDNPRFDAIRFADAVAAAYEFNYG